MVSRQRLPSHTVIRKIAETTLGDVFEAEDSISGFRVAIKVRGAVCCGPAPAACPCALHCVALECIAGVSPRAQSHRKFRLTEKQTQSLVRQIKILARLRHPHIVRLWAVFEDLITLYIVYELCQARRRMSELAFPTGSPPPRPSPTRPPVACLQQPTALVQSCFQDERVTVSKIIAPLASALAHVHSKGILHRGVHPSALVTTCGHPITAAPGTVRQVRRRP